MCVGAILTLLEEHEEDGVRVGLLDDGSTVPLSFVPDARVGAQLLVHLGLPVEVLDSEVAREALCLRAQAQHSLSAEHRPSGARP